LREIGNFPESIFALSWIVMAEVKLMRIGLIAVAIGVAAVAAILLMRTFQAPAQNNHRVARQFVLDYTLSRVDDPIIVLGDSIVEASMLPRSACGHAIVNAGLNGASTTSDLGAWLKGALAGKRAAAIIVALGTNDALTSPLNETAFAERYGTLLGGLSELTSRIAVLAIPTVEIRQRLTAEMEKEIKPNIDKLNAVLPDIARRAGATFLPLPDMPSPHTIDGVHLDAAGYEVWDKAVMDGATSVCG
jgi:lysophospholipase L1-like esterase